MAKKPTCLLCNNEEDRRGLCSTHYFRFVRAKNSIPSDKQAAFEKALIEKKLLAPIRKPGPQIDRDEFAEIAAELTGSPHEREVAAKQQSIAKSVERVKRKISKQNPKPKSKSNSKANDKPA
jgi:hypothetical protein